VPRCGLDAARDALAAGAYREAVEALRELDADAQACALRVRALANLEVGEAERSCRAALQLHPLSIELHYLHAILLIAQVRLHDAIRAARRIVYLDRGSALGYVMLGRLLGRTGDIAGARRAYRNARHLLVAQPPDAVVPLADGERAGRLGELAAMELALLDAAPSVVAR
jgi:chemotaxis protein methyltransferase CheR